MGHPAVRFGMDRPEIYQLKAAFRYKSGLVSVSEIFRHLIAPKRLHGINQSGAASRDVAGEKRDGNQN